MTQITAIQGTDSPKIKIKDDSDLVTLMRKIPSLVEATDNEVNHWTDEAKTDLTNGKKVEALKGCEENEVNNEVPDEEENAS